MIACSSVSRLQPVYYSDSHWSHHVHNQFHHHSNSPGDCFLLLGGIASNVHIYVRDVDATYKAALAARAISVQEPVRKEDEDKRGGVRDTGGTTWWVATRVIENTADSASVEAG